MTISSSFRTQWSLLVLAIAMIAVASPAVAQLNQHDAGPGGVAFGSALGQGKSPVSVRAELTAPTQGKPGFLFVTATIQQGWHIYSITQSPDGAIPTQIQVTPPQGVRIVDKFRPTVEPETHKESFDNLVTERHYGTVTWYAPVELSAEIDPATLKIDGKLTVGACDEKSCLPPQKLAFSAGLGSGVPIPVPNSLLKKGTGSELIREYSVNNSGREVSVPPFQQATNVGAAKVGAPASGVSSDAEESRKEPAAAMDMQAVLVQLGLAFLGGLILNLMPCVLPVISLKILSFLQQSGESRGRVFALNVWYSAGLLSVFMVLAALAASAGLAWGEQFTLPWFKVAMTAFVFVMAISFLGVWEIPIPGFVGTGPANELQAKEGPSGAFFKGIFTTILATPCSGPFLGPVFGYLLKQPPYMAYCVFGAVGLGMASPYLLIGAFPQLIRVLPKPGAWMETVKQFMAFLLLGTVVYLFSTMSAAYFIPTLSLLVGLWFACWWIGRTPITAAPQWQFAAWFGGPAVAALVGWLAFTTMLHESKIPWQPFSPEAVTRARAEGKTVMVDFTANWCPNCKTNSKFAIETDAVRDLLQANGVVPMLADWTDPSPVIKKTLNDLGCNSIPVLAIWPGQSTDKKVIVLADVLLESQVLDALKQAGPSQPR